MMLDLETQVAGTWYLIYIFYASFFVLEINTALSAASQRPMCLLLFKYGMREIEPSTKK